MKLINIPNINFHENPSGGSCADTCGQTDRRLDMKKETGVFPEYAK
jgi:hypothetical protein